MNTKKKGGKFKEFVVYVDNFYFFLKQGSRLGVFVRKVKEAFAAMNVPLHEWQVGKRIKAVGWEWWSDEMVMVCPLTKSSSSILFLYK